MNEQRFRPGRPETAVTAATSAKPLWRPVSDAFAEAVDIMKRRKSGELQSIKTPWKSMNNVGLNGIDWNSMMVVCARPGQGKSLLAQMICREAHALNKGQDFDILRLEFEMMGQTSALRELSARFEKSTRYLQSAEEGAPLTEADLRRAEAYAKAQIGRNEFLIETPMTAKASRQAILDFYNVRKKPVLITIDHSALFETDLHEKDKMAVLYSVGAMITDLKRKYPFAFVVLSQLNRSIDEPGRHEPGSEKNYPNESDIFGADAMLQFADVLLAIVRPAKYHISCYGPSLFHITNDKLLAFHYMKVRNGTPQISFMLDDFKHMNIKETLPPAQMAKVPPRRH
jgi:replicative DNA helicase